MFKKRWKRLKTFFSALETKKHNPKLDYTYSPKSAFGALLNPIARISEMYTPVVTEEQFRRNMQRIELAKLEQARESTNNNLKAQHRLMVATILASAVALISASAAIYISLHSKSQVVNVKPNVIIKQ